MHEIATAAACSEAARGRAPLGAGLEDLDDFAARGPPLEVCAHAQAIAGRGAGDEDRAVLAKVLHVGHAVAAGGDLGDGDDLDLHRHAKMAYPPVASSCLSA